MTNAGITSGEAVSGDALTPFVEMAVASLDFAMADPTSNYYGAIRAAMGHAAPFNISFVAIGNENCLSYAFSPAYPANFAAIQAAIKSRYPFVQTIANCWLQNNTAFPGADVYSDFWDYHVYTSVQDFINSQYMWETYPRAPGTPKVFASEYAVTQDCGTGNLFAAIGESLFLLSMERNADVVPMGAYAPLLVNNNDRDWNPDAIVYDSTSSYGTPSYWTQVLFSQANAGGVLLAFSANATGGTSTTPAPFAPGIPLFNNVPNASLSVSRDSAGDVIVKWVNYGATPQVVMLALTGAGATQPPVALLQQISSADVMAENSFAAPTNVTIVESYVPAGPADAITFPPNSINFLRLLTARGGRNAPR